MTQTSYSKRAILNILKLISLIALFLPALNSGCIKKVFSILFVSIVVHCCLAQVITAPYLRCVVENAASSANTLTWDAAANNPCGPFAYYVIYKSTSPAGPFVRDTVITDQNATTWVDNSINGSATWYYYVMDSFNCNGITYYAADTVENEANPKTPDIVDVSVNADSTITFVWQPSASPQTRFYVIYVVAPNGNHIPVDTVYGRFNTTWTDSVDNPYGGSLNYTVAAGDSCAGNQLSAYNTRQQQTMLLNYTAAKCNPAIPLTWSKYINMTGGLGGYEVLVSNNLGPFSEVAALDSATLTYNYTNFNDGDSIQAYIVAVGKADTTIKSSSNYMRFVASVIKPPAFLYLTQLSVDTNTNTSVNTTWIVDTHAKMLNYQIYHSEDGLTYNSLHDSRQGVTPATAPPALFTSYADSTVQPQYGPYWFYVQGNDSCQTDTITAPGEIISLQGNLSDYYQITLNWNLFHLYGATVLKYDLFRDFGTGMQFVHSFDSTKTTYIDSVFQYLNLPGEFCYVIQATYIIDLPAAHYNATLLTYSNIACIDHRPIIYIPNAFVWNGVNNFFKPRIIFGDPAGYDMTIWDRYGGKIFETHDPEGKWYGTDDGTLNGHPVDQGGYPYLIKFTALDGTEVERKGIVLFIKK